MTPISAMNFAEFERNARAALLAERHPDGYWVGELSASALSTATAVFTLSLLKDERYSKLVSKGLNWLASTQNADGGWGDTVLSFSNISTTCLVWAALSASDLTPRPPLRSGKREIDIALSATRAEAWIRNAAGSLKPKALAKTIADKYGKDRTFSVPILTMLALANRLGPDPWKLIPQLPFELAALPHAFFQVLRLPVVSYALPALIAIGQVRHAKRPTWNPFTRVLRYFAKSATLKKLRAIQPTTGGYLEATPLTSFVAMSLIGAGQHESEVVREGVKFLERSAQPDGSWPIDTNLTTWVTTLSINALSPPSPPAGEGLGVGGILEVSAPVVNGLQTPLPLTPNPSPTRLEDSAGERGVSEWLLNQQYRILHPYTNAAPGGWAWTDLSGGVPDADDTPSALLALANLGEADDKTLSASQAGVTWLLDLQNSDGGIPTFCKGWTGLPFDRSSNDLTAHAVRAWAVWRDRMPKAIQNRIDRATDRAANYLLRTQRPDGAWAPLWFGNQHSAEIENLTYGTSRVLKLARVIRTPSFEKCLSRGFEFLLNSQNPDGGWGGRANTPSSIEETALALEGLSGFPSGGWKSPEFVTSGDFHPPLGKALEYLTAATRNGTHFPPSPIGFYFANLWYYEKLYPIIFTVAALSKIREESA